jgi:hypothetical protein
MIVVDSSILVGIIKGERDTETLVDLLTIEDCAIGAPTRTDDGPISEMSAPREQCQFISATMSRRSRKPTSQIFDRNAADRNESHPDGFSQALRKCS